MENKTNPAVVKIGKGKETHLAVNPGIRAVAYCKGMRVHRAFVVSDDLNRITCEKCLHQARRLGLVQTPDQVERDRLELELRFARSRVDDTRGFPEKHASALKRERAALDALVAFNLKTIRMVPVTHVRHG